MHKNWVIAIYKIAVFNDKSCCFNTKKYPGEKLYTDFSLYLGLINITGFIKKPSEDNLIDLVPELISKFNKIANEIIEKRAEKIAAEVNEEKQNEIEL